MSIQKEESMSKRKIGWVLAAVAILVLMVWFFYLLIPRTTAQEFGLTLRRQWCETMESYFSSQFDLKADYTLKTAGDTLTLDGTLTVDGTPYPIHVENWIPRSLHARIRYALQSAGTYPYQPDRFDFEIPVGEAKLLVTMVPSGVKWRGSTREDSYVRITVEDARGYSVEEYDSAKE